MAFTGHVAEHRIAAGVVAGIAFGIRQGLLVDGDIPAVTGTLAAAKAAVEADAAKLHVSQRLFAPRVTASLDRAAAYAPGYFTSGDADSIYSITNLNGPIRGLALRF